MSVPGYGLDRSVPGTMSRQCPDEAPPPTPTWSANVNHQRHVVPGKEGLTFKSCFSRKKRRVKCGAASADDSRGGTILIGMMNESSSPPRGGRTRLICQIVRVGIGRGTFLSVCADIGISMFFLGWSGWEGPALGLG